MTDNFFNKLSERFKSENDLSDITWAIGEACPPFQKLFVQFFFKDITDLSKISIFKREHSDDNCRPDFYIKIDNVEIVIECKINDRCHHFEQYKLQFPTARFGYITNYPLSYLDKDYEIRQWSGFKKFIEQEIKSETDTDVITLVSGYLKYLTNVCGIFNLKKMNLNNLSSLYHFNHLIKKIANSIEDHETSLYNQGKITKPIGLDNILNLKKMIQLKSGLGLEFITQKEYAFILSSTRNGARKYMTTLNLRNLLTVVNISMPRIKMMIMDQQFVLK